MFHPVLLPVPGTFGLVGFDAADVVGGALHQSLDQTVGLYLKGRGGTFSPAGRVTWCTGEPAVFQSVNQG